MPKSQFWTDFSYHVCLQELRAIGYFVYTKYSRSLSFKPTSLIMQSSRLFDICCKNLNFGSISLIMFVCRNWELQVIFYILNIVEVSILKWLLLSWRALGYLKYIVKISILDRFILLCEGLTLEGLMVWGVEKTLLDRFEMGVRYFVKWSWVWQDKVVSFFREWEQEVIYSFLRGEYGVILE